MTLDEIKEAVVGLGWKITVSQNSGNVGWCAWKTLSAIPDCVCNEKPPSLILIPWGFEHSSRYESCEFEIRGEIPDGTWLKLGAYSLTPDEAMERLVTIEMILCAAWRAAHEAGEAHTYEQERLRGD